MLLIYTKQNNSRIRYVFKQLFERILGVSIKITTNIETFESYNGAKLSYGKQPLGNELFFYSVDLLFQQGINDETIIIKKWDTVPCFYEVLDSKSIIPFDVLAASFYLLSRYEEYLPQVKDELGRFTAKQSIAYQNGFLQLPVIDLWAFKIKIILQEKFPDLEYEAKNITSEIICEVNEAFAYHKKGWTRTIEGCLYDFFSLKFKDLYMRIKVILGLQKDPYHTYNYIVNSSRKKQIPLIFFFGLGNYSTHEKSTSYHSITYRNLIKSIADYCTIGLRLSYDSQENTKVLNVEKKRFELTTYREAHYTFCQYAKINLPNMYRNLIEQEVVNDYSMGYQDHAGFRAGTCTPFLFFDLDYEIQTPLKITPFCLSENAFSKITDPEKAVSQMEIIINDIRQVNGHAVFHINNRLFNPFGDRVEFWKKIYASFIDLCQK